MGSGCARRPQCRPSSVPHCVTKGPPWWRSSEALQRIDNNLQQAQQNEGGHIDPAVTCRPISESELTQILSVVEADSLGYHGGIWFLETCYVAQEWAELSAGVFQADGFRAILRHIGGNWSLVDYGSDVWPNDTAPPIGSRSPRRG